jgi:hypothetical protein
MNGPSKQMLKRLAAAVEWRSWAVGWTIIAERLGTRPEVCQRWPARYPDVWSRLMREAELRRWDELCRDASIALEGLLRSSDPQVREQAQRLVAKHRMRKQPVVGPDERVEEIWTRS